MSPLLSFPLSSLHLSVSRSAPPSLAVPPPCFPDGEAHHKQIQAGGEKKKPLLSLPLPYLWRSFCLSGSEIGTGDQFESILKGEAGGKKVGGVYEGGGGLMWLPRPPHHHIYPPPRVIQ